MDPRGRNPQARSLAATVEETATVAAPSRSVRRYSARVPRVSGRPSISSRPSECSVATEGVPASRAAVRPWTQARYRCVCTRSYPPCRTSRASRGTAARSRLPRIPRCRTRTPSARSSSATAPGLVRVTTSQRAGRWRSSSRNCRSAPPTPRPVMTCRTFTDAPSHGHGREAQPVAYRLRAEAGTAVGMADVGTGQGQWSARGARREGAAEGVPGLPHRGEHPRVDLPVRVAEPGREGPGDPLQGLPAAVCLAAQRGVGQRRQVEVAQPVRADLHARRRDGPDAVLGEQRPARAQRVPVVGAARPAGQDEHGRRTAVREQHRKRLVEEVGVPVVEGQPDQGAPLGRVGAQQRGDGHPGQAPAAQPGQLLVQAVGGDGDAVRIVRRVGHRVVGEDPRRPRRGVAGACPGAAWRGVSGHGRTSVG